MAGRAQGKAAVGQVARQLAISYTAKVGIHAQGDVKTRTEVTKGDMAISYEDARRLAREKAAQADYGSPFRRALTQMAPAAIARYCPPRGEVLDIGCGSGRYAYFFIEAGVTGAYTGIDISDERWTTPLDLPAELPGQRLVQDAHEADRLGREFDFVLSFTAFEHFADDRRAARAVAKVLKPGAHALIVVPSVWSFPLYGPHGYRRYTEKSLRELATQAGLETVELRRVGGLAGWLFHFHWFFPAWVFRSLGKAVLYAAFGFDRARARRAAPRLTAFLDRLGEHHLRWSWGRRFHAGLLRLTAALDRFLPSLEVGYLAVWRRPALASDKPVQ